MVLFYFKQKSSRIIATWESMKRGSETEKWKHFKLCYFFFPESSNAYQSIRAQ